MNVSLVFLVVAAILMSAVSARYWYEGDGGQVRWDRNCDFAGYDFHHRESTSEVCGALCVAEPQCTHFTHNNGICYLKRNTASWYEQNAYEMVCGFVVGRSKQSVGVRYFYFY